LETSDKSATEGRCGELFLESPWRFDRKRLRSGLKGCLSRLKYHCGGVEIPGRRIWEISASGEPDVLGAIKVIVPKV
jgi:hypothetical protein